MQVCPEWKEKIAEVAAGAGGLRAPDAALREHLLVCGGCRAWADRVDAQARVLAGLSRYSAPAELELRVAAEIRNPGRMVDRWLHRLRRVSAPAELWGRTREVVSREKFARESASLRLRRWTRWSAVAAACFVVAAGAALFSLHDRSPRNLPLSVREVEDLSGLSPSSSVWIEGVFGVSVPKKRVGGR